jgi:membrane protease subunit HflC
MRSFFRFLVLVALLVTAIWACTFTVNETQFAIVQRFGNPRDVVTESGLYIKWPPPLDTVQYVDRRTHVLDPGSAEYLTADKKNVEVSCFMVWAVADPLMYWTSVSGQRGAEARLTDLMASKVGTILGSHELSVLVSAEAQELTMDEVMSKITQGAAGEARENFGIEISSIRIKRLSFPLQNKQAVFRRMEAERERIARLYRSEGEEAAEKIRQTANRERAELVNEANRQAEETRGLADAEATRIYAEAFSQDPDFYAFLRSLQTYEKIIQENSTVVVPSDAEILRVLKDPDSILTAVLEGSGGQDG